MSSDRAIRIEHDAIGSALITGDHNTVTIVYQDIRSVPETRKPEPAARAIGPNPYKGLMAFDENDADRFFGREDLIKELWRRFAALYDPPPDPDAGGLRLLPILGPSGSGKSSLARAGLVPEIARQSLPALKRPRVAILTPGAHPLEALALVLARLATGETAPVKKAKELEGSLRETDENGAHDGLRRIADALPDIANTHLIVLIDQFEEAYVSPAGEQDRKRFEGERDAFIANLLHAARDRAGRVSAIITMRSDFLGATIRHPELNAHISRQGFIVPAMQADELARAIQAPAEQAGSPISEAVTRRLVEQSIGREGALPLLQFVLEQIWEALPRDPQKTIDEIGGVGGALAGRAQALYDRLTARDQRIARHAFLAMIHLGEGTDDTRRRASLDELVTASADESAVRRVLETFARPGQRLISLRTDMERQSVAAEVTHEALVQHWGTLRDWISQDRDDIRFERRLNQAALLWDTGEGGLWRPPDLDLLERFAAQSGRELTQRQERFRQASRDVLKREQRQATVVRMAVAALAVIMTVLGALSFYLYKDAEKKSALLQESTVELRAALSQAQANEVRAQQNESRALAALADQASRQHDHATAIGLALAALPKTLDNPDRAYAPEALSSLCHAVFQNRERTNFVGHESSVRSAVFDPSGERVLTASYDGTARLWDAASGRPLAVLEGHENWVYSAVFDPSGERVLTASNDRTARIWTVPPWGQGLIDQARAIQPRHLTDEQRLLYQLSQERPPRRSGDSHTPRTEAAADE